MDVAITIFRIGVGVGAVLVGLGIILIAIYLRPLARDARALANDARRLANLAERELSGLIDGARELGRDPDVTGRIGPATVAPVQSPDATEDERIA
ncbi:MAG TPA: hypothetical protein VFL75_07005 [Candidatus Limnocylindria bacterium]|jgi:hypothetical protein|nr:hypothetical protein [Candidatus Limnocylindria bacterium]